LESLDTAKNAYGEEERSYTVQDTVWAHITDLRGREFLEADKVSSEVTTKITIRHGTSVVPKWRVVHGTDYYDVIAVIKPDDNHEFAELWCRRLPDGELPA